MHAKISTSFMGHPFMARSCLGGCLSALILGLFLAGCSSSTTISEWSCPTDQPDGCFSVADGDAIALGTLKADGQPAGRSVTVPRHAIPPNSTNESVLKNAPSGNISDSKIPGDDPVLASPAVVDTAPTDLTALANDRSTADRQSGVTPDTIMPGSSGATGETGTRPTADPYTAPHEVRIPERLAEVWIGPFEDAAGNWHPASRLFIVIEPARWTSISTGPADDLHGRAGGR